MIQTFHHHCFIQESIQNCLNYSELLIHYSSYEWYSILYLMGNQWPVKQYSSTCGSFAPTVWYLCRMQKDCTNPLNLRVTDRASVFRGFENRILTETSCLDVHFVGMMGTLIRHETSNTKHPHIPNTRQVTIPNVPILSITNPMANTSTVAGYPYWSTYYIVTQ